MFQGSNSGPNLTNSVEITASHIYLQQQTGVNRNVNDLFVNQDSIIEYYYDKTQTDAMAYLKANATDVYTKRESAAALDLKANVVDVYTKIESDTALLLKANANNAEITGYLQTNKLKL